MAWTAPRTWSTGDINTAADFNEQIRDNLLALDQHAHGGSAGDGATLNLSKTGSYTGDGSVSLAITGVGFTPAYVRIWEKATVDGTAVSAWETTTEMIDDLALHGATLEEGGGGINLFDNRIISLDTDGFKVDDDSADGGPNTSGKVYNYLCRS